MSNILDFIKRYNILTLIILGFLLYFPSLFYDFVYDDISLLLSNQYLNGRISIHFFDFFKPGLIIEAIYTPLTFIVYWLIIKIFGFNSFVFHFINIFFYILSSIVLYYLLKKIINNDLIDFFAIVLFILHPCHIECTAWISAMGYNIASLFFFLSFLYFIIAFDENKKLNYIYSVIFYVLAILSQPIAVTLPLILFLWVYFFRKERLKESITYVASYIPFLFIYLYLFYITVNLEHLNRFTSLHHTFVEKISILGFDIFNSFIPVSLCPIQPIPNIYFIVPVLIFIFLFFYFIKDRTYTFFIIFGLISILPYSNIFFNIAIPLADRYLLLFSVFSCVFLAYFSYYIFTKFKTKILIKYLSFVFFILLFFFSFLFYLPNWKNERSLWIYAYSVNPNNILIARTYVDYLIFDKKYDDALVLADKIIEKYPNFFEGYEVKIRALIEMSLFKEALDICYKVKEIIPDNYENYLYFFNIYFYLQDYDKAIYFLNIAEEKCVKYNLLKNKNMESFAEKRVMLSYVEANPDKFIENFKILSNDFRLMKDGGDFSSILRYTDYKNRENICLNYLKSNVEYSISVIRLLSCLYMKETYKENASQIMKSMLKDMSRAQEFMNKGDNISAEKIYLDVISKNKYMYEAYYNLGILYLQTNRQKIARDIFSQMLNINPNDEQVKHIYNSL